MKGRKHCKGCGLPVSLPHAEDCGVPKPERAGNRLITAAADLTAFTRQELRDVAVEPTP